jgi:hypothetical protein
MLRRIALVAAAGVAVLALVAAAKPTPSGTGYELVTRTVSYAPVLDNGNGKEITEVVACPVGKRAVNGGLQSIANAPGTPSEFPSNYSRQYAGATQNFNVGVSPPDLTLPPPSGPTADGWRVTGRVFFSGWGTVNDGTRGFEWDRFGAEVTLYAICVNP